RNGHLRAQNDHRKRDSHLPPPSDRSKSFGQPLFEAAAQPTAKLAWTQRECPAGAATGCRDGKAAPARLLKRSCAHAALAPSWRLASNRNQVRRSVSSMKTSSRLALPESS